MTLSTTLKAAALSALAGIIMTGCGNGSDTATEEPGYGQQQQDPDQGEGSGSNIGYLVSNHANYSENGSTATPAPVKNASTLSLTWTIDGKTETDAQMLAEHITFMDEKLKEGENPRAFDKLFLMEAYMKYNKYYTTSVERAGTTVVVSKNATNACAYNVIAAHSDAVSGDFFARGDITNDYSATAEAILADAACDAMRSDIETYIAQRQRGM